MGHRVSVGTLVHLAEIAARRGDVAALERNVRALGLTDADSVLAIRTNLMQRCLRRGPTSLARQDPVRPVSMYHVGFALWGGSVREARDCGRAAFRAALDADVRVGAEDWGSLVGLHGLLASAGRDAEAMHLVDSAITAGLGQAVGLHVVGAAAGMDIGARADAFIAQLWQGIETRAAPSLWLLTLWSMRSGDVAGIERAVGRLDARRRSPGLRVDSLLAAVGEAYLLLARGDSAAALSAFDALRPTAELHQLENSLWEPLAPERLTHARLLLARGKAIDAHRVASTFDHPGILVHALFQRPSLEVRLAAARALGDAGLEREARQRLDELAKMP